MAPAVTDWLNAGRYLDILLSDPATQLISEFVASLETTATTDSSKNDNAATAATTASSGKGGRVLPQESVAVGLAALNAFLQGNVTGPVLEAEGLRKVEARFGGIRSACLRSLEVDGVSVYEHVPLVEVFGLARWVLGRGMLAGAGEGAARSGAWLALRVHVWHYKLLTQPTLGPGAVFNKSSQWCDVPSLQGKIETGLEEVGAEVLEGGEGWSALEKVQFLVEKANVCMLLGLDGKAREALRRATELSGFLYALSGALGKRTRFQEKSTSQLVVLARSGGEGKAKEEDQSKPQTLALNDDTLLEDLQFTKETREDEAKSGLPAPLRELSPDDQPQLSPLDQIILLAEATLKDAFSPADTLTSEEILPFAVRVISDKSSNWQIYSHALLVRSRIEMHRSRTVERGVLQMQAVVDQVVVDTTQPIVDVPEAAQNGDSTSTVVPEVKVTRDEDSPPKPDHNKPTSFFPAPKPTESAPAEVRLEYIHALSSPPRWHLECELAYSWASVGSLVSALEIFKRLRLWAEVSLCFASSAAKDDEDGRGNNGEAKAKAVLRWRLFQKTGTQEDGSEADETADLDSLKEADYHGPERQPAPPNAPRLWCILGDIENDPAHYERAWEISNRRFARAQKSLGEHHLQQKDLVRARDAYKKAVAVNRLSSELWNRMGDINLRMGDFSEAAEAFSRAIASADNLGGGEDARTWSNLGSALYSLYVERVKELKQEKAGGETESSTNIPTRTAADEEAEEEQEDDTIPPNPSKPPSSHRDPATLLTQSLAAYKRGASIANDNWRIWDNVVTLASRLRPIPVSDLLLALRSVLRIRASEDALDIDVLRLLINEAVLSHEKPAEPVNGGQQADGVYEPPRGSPQRAVCEFLERDMVPLVTTRSDLWELVTRERVWRRDYAGAVDAAERAWRAAIGGVTGAGSAGLVPGAGGGGGNWLEDKEGWRTVVERTDELVSVFENYGPEVLEIGSRWKGKARSAVRSVMGKAKESWEGSEGWERLVGLLDGLK